MGRGVAVVGRAALDHVGDEHVFSSHADRCEQLVEQLSGAPNERQPLLILVVSGAFANEHHVGRDRTVAWDGLGSLRSQRAEGAFVNAPIEIVDRCGEDVVAGHGISEHATNGVGRSSIGRMDNERCVNIGHLIASWTSIGGHTARYRLLRRLRYYPTGRVPRSSRNSGRSSLKCSASAASRSYSGTSVSIHVISNRRTSRSAMCACL